MMKTLKYYWLRFKSNTPVALKRLQGLLVAISASTVAALAFMAQYGMQSSQLYNILTYVGVAAAFAVPILQFATSDTELQ